MIAFGLFLAFWVIASAAVNIKERVRHIKGGLWERLRGAGTRLLGHAARAPRHRGVHHRGHAGQGLRGRARRAAWTSATRSRSATTRSSSRARAKIRGPNYTGARGTVEVTKNGKYRRAPDPEKRIYNVQQMPMTEAAIDSGVARRPLRLARRAGRQRRLERAHLLQAVHHLDLGRLRADGHRRPRRAVGSPLSVAGAPHDMPSKARRRGPKPRCARSSSICCRWRSSWSWRCSCCAGCGSIRAKCRRRSSTSRHRCSRWRSWRSRRRSFRRPT